MNFVNCFNVIKIGCLLYNINVKELLKSIKISFVIIGAMLGAAFLSGKEFTKFFYGQDSLFSALIIFFVLFLSFTFLLVSDVEKNSKCYLVFGCLFYFGNFIVASSMVAAVDSLSYTLFPNIQEMPIFSVTVLIFVNILLICGFQGIKRFSLMLVPFVVVAAIVIVFIPNDKVSIKSGLIQPSALLTYCGLNISLSVPLISRLGRGEGKHVCIISAFFAALIISTLIYVFSLCLNGCDISVIASDLPILQILADKKSFYLCYILVLFVGVITSLTSTYYPIYNLFSDFKFGIIGKILLPSVCFLVSRLGFYDIVGKIYPLIGVIGILSLIIFAVELFFFRRRRPKNTLRRQADTVLPYRSLQGRV